MIKTRISKFLSVFLVLCMISNIPIVSIATDDSSLWNYSVSNGEVTILGHKKPKGDLVIPKTIEGLPVTSIGYRAFADCWNITSITIPESVTNIGNRVFNFCKKLTTITVNENNKNYCSVDGVLFNKDKTTLIRYPEYKSQTEYEIPNSVTIIDDSAFYGCEGLLDVTLPKGITYIGDRAFYGCLYLNDIAIPEGLTSIGNNVFQHCGCFKSVTIPDNVTSIGNMAFYDCGNLVNLTIPKSVTTISDKAFGICNLLVNVYYTGTKEQWDSISLGSGNEDITEANLIFIHKCSYTKTKEIHATCTKPGKIVYSCDCGNSYEENLDATGHLFVADEVIPAQLSVNGYTIYKCDACGTTKKDDFTPALELKIKEGEFSEKGINIIWDSNVILTAWVKQIDNDGNIIQVKTVTDALGGETFIPNFNKGTYSYYILAKIMVNGSPKYIKSNTITVSVSEPTTSFNVGEYTNNGFELSWNENVTTAWIKVVNPDGSKRTIKTVNGKNSTFIKNAKPGTYRYYITAKMLVGKTVCYVDSELVEAVVPEKEYTLFGSYENSKINLSWNFDGAYVWVKQELSDGKIKQIAHGNFKNGVTFKPISNGLNTYYIIVKDSNGKYVTTDKLVINTSI